MGREEGRGFMMGSRPLGSASDHPLTPSSKGRGVGLCAGPLFPEAVCPACEPVPLTAVLLVSQAPPATAGADQAEVVTGRWYQCSSMPFSRGLCGKLRNTERTNKVNETQVAHRKRGMWCVISIRMLIMNILLRRGFESLDIKV